MKKENDIYICSCFKFKEGIYLCKHILILLKKLRQSLEIDNFVINKFLKKDIKFGENN